MENVNYSKSRIINLLEDGLKKAVDSFSKIINQKMSLQIKWHNEIVLPTTSTDNEDKLNVLTTQVIGDVHGKSFLILSPSEVNEVTKILGGKQNDQLQTAFLLEIDNIVSATVISSLSNQLSLEIYGDVPWLTIISQDELEQFLVRETKDYTVNSVEAILILDGNPKFKARFYWYFQDNLVQLSRIDKVPSNA